MGPCGLFRDDDSWHTPQSQFYIRQTSERADGRTDGHVVIRRTSERRRLSHWRATRRRRTTALSTGQIHHRRRYERSFYTSSQSPVSKFYTRVPFFPTVFTDVVETWSSQGQHINVWKIIIQIHKRVFYCTYYKLKMVISNQVLRNLHRFEKNVLHFFQGWIPDTFMEIVSVSISIKLTRTLPAISVRAASAHGQWFVTTSNVASMKL